MSKNLTNECTILFDALTYSFRESEVLTYNNLKWLPVNSGDTKFTYLQIDSQPDLVDDPFRERVDFWESLAIPS